DPDLAEAPRVEAYPLGEAHLDREAHRPLEDSAHLDPAEGLEDPKDLRRCQP
ncbi:MAG: hypothetical protein GY856_10550, partial [bacterium]|nr:hypothetical protein [bacterium]